MGERKFFVEYVVHEQSICGKWHPMTGDCKKGPYKYVEVLKDETKDVLGKYLSDHNCEDGEYIVDAVIEADDKWYDSDTFMVVYQGGEVVDFKEI